MSQEDPQRTVQTFIDLVARHEQSFYSFVHKVHSKGQGLFDALMTWIERFLAYAREGLHDQIDLEFLLPFAGEERLQILREVDAVAAYHYRLKLAYEEKVRRRFQKSAATDDEAALIDGMIASLNLNDSVVGDMEEVGEEDEDSGEESDDWEEEDQRSAALSRGLDDMQDWSAADTRGKRSSLRGQGEPSSANSRSSFDHTRSSMDKIRHPMQNYRERHNSQDLSQPNEKRPPPAKPVKLKSRKGKRGVAQQIEMPVLQKIPSLTPVLVEMVSDAVIHLAQC